MRRQDAHTVQAHLLSCLTGASRPNEIHHAFRMAGGIPQWMAQLMSQDLGRQTRQQNVKIRAALARLNIPAIANYQLVGAEASLSGRALREGIILRKPYGSKRMVRPDLLGALGSNSGDIPRPAAL